MGHGELGSPRPRVALPAPVWHSHVCQGLWCRGLAAFLPPTQDIGVRGEELRALGAGCWDGAGAQRQGDEAGTGHGESWQRDPSQHSHGMRHKKCRERVQAAPRGPAGSASPAASPSFIRFPVRAYLCCLKPRL